MMELAVEITHDVNNGKYQFIIPKDIDNTFLNESTSIKSRIYTLHVVKTGLHVKYNKKPGILMDKLARVEWIIRILKNY
jgi:hypothetical protein